MKETVLDKFLKLQELLKEEFPQFSNEKELYKVIGRLETWHYPKKRWKGMELSRDEAKLYEWMLNHKYNPGTIYKWFRILGFNKEIRQKIKNKKLSFNEAKTYPKPFRRLTDLESELMYNIKQCFDRYIVR